MDGNIDKVREATDKLCHQIYDVLPISPALKLLDDGKLYSLITAHDEAIRREEHKRCIALVEKNRFAIPVILAQVAYNTAIDDCISILSAEPAQDNWRRILACVNACAGMEDPEQEISEIQTQLQEALAAIENQKDFISTLKAQRDELLAAANRYEFRELQLVEALKAYIDKYGPGYSCTDRLAYDNATGILSAIANAEKDKP